jgi:hypothetical protein
MLNSAERLRFFASCNDSISVQNITATLHSIIANLFSFFEHVLKPINQVHRQLFVFDLLVRLDLFLDSVLQTNDFHLVAA